MEKYVWNNNLKIRLMGEGIFNLFYWMYFPFIAIYFANELGLKIAGLLMTVPPAVSIIGNMIGGNLADQLGRRLVMLIGISIQTIMFAFFSLSFNSWFDYFAFIGIGFGGALYGPASDAMVADLVPESFRRQVFATYITANNIGAVLGPILGAIFFFHYRSELLWTCTIVMLLYFIAVFLKVDETLPKYNQKAFPFNTNITSLSGQWKGYLIILKDKVFILYILAGVLSIVTIMQLDLYLAIYMTEYVPAQTFIKWGEWNVFLESTEILGWILGFNGLLFILFVLPVSHWFKRWQDRDVFILSCILAGGGMFAVGLTTNIWLLFVCTLFFTFGEIVRSPVIHNFVSQYAPENARGQYMATSRLQFTIGRFFAPVTVFLSAFVPPIFIFGLILGCALISLILYIIVFKLHTVPKNGC